MKLFADFCKFFNLQVLLIGIFTVRSGNSLGNFYGNKNNLQLLSNSDNRPTDSMQLSEEQLFDKTIFASPLRKLVLQSFTKTTTEEKSVGTETTGTQTDKNLMMNGDLIPLIDEKTNEDEFQGDGTDDDELLKIDLNCIDDEDVVL